MKTLDPAKTQKQVLGYLRERFGLTEAELGGFGLYMASKGRIYLGPRRTIDRPPAVSLGLLVARVSGTVKPSTNLLQSFGRHISRNLIILTREQAMSFARGSDLEVGEDALGGATDGYVLLKYGDAPLGCGLLRGRSVRNMLPKAKRLELRYL
jgi:hypothetical protein